ncbi:unnamed protein product [Amoebophrya sp. A120]|nr:unnamed protein product [Amoebophrya sp. A120]|eukprot:GSA120T00013484001.1
MRIGAFLKPGGDYFEYSTSNGNRLSGDTPIRYLDDWKNGEPEIVLRYAFTKTASSAVEAGSSSSSHETVASLTREQKARLTKEQQCAVLHGAKKYQSSEDLVLQDIRNGRVDIQNAEDYLRNQVPFDVRRNYRLMNSLVCLAPRVLQYATRDVLRTHAPAPVPKRERKQVRFKKIFKGWESDTDVEARIKNLPSQNSNVVVPGPQCDYSHHLRRYVRNEQPCDVVPRPGCAHSHVPHRSGRSAPGRSSPSRDAGSPGLQETSDFALGDRLKRINALNNFTYIGWERIGGEDDKRRWVARRESVNPNRCTFNLPKRECTRCCRRLRGASQEEQVRSVYRGLVSVSRALCCYLV